MILQLALVMGALLLLTGVNSDSKETPIERWYRGNTHAHTALSGHGDSSPEDVASWYLEHGYNFLILSEHNRFIDPTKVRLPSPRRSDFILIPGEEVTGKQYIHMTAMNIHRVVPWQFDDEDKSRIVQAHADNIRAAGGLPILNHPSYRKALTTDDLLPVDGLHLFELFNGHMDDHDGGSVSNAPTASLWDSLLSQGMVVYGVASDDSHDFKTFGPYPLSNPGRGWVVVRALELTPDAVTASMDAGHFYSSSGVWLKSINNGHGRYAIEVDVERTQQELSQPGHIGDPQSWKSDDEFVIDFIGSGGEILHTSHSDHATFQMSWTESPYVRAQVTWVKRTERGLEAFYAWGQPIFKTQDSSRIIPE